ncbi:MAG: hypothetical protein ACE5J2_05475 [Nitrososphaerales archaeon]
MTISVKALDIDTVRHKIGYSLPITLVFLLAAQYVIPVFAQQQTVEERVIVLLAEFPDTKFNRSAEEIEQLVFEDADTIFKQASFNKVSINGAVIPTKYMMPNTLSYYGRNNFDNSLFLNDLIAMADHDVDFNKSWVLVYHAGKTRPTGNAIFKQGITGDGEMIRGFARIDSTFSEPVTVHELAHLFGRLPDLYDTSRPVDNIRSQFQSDIFYYDLDIMGAKRHGGFSAYSRLKLGWMDQNFVEVRPGQDRMVTLRPVESCDEGVCAVKITVDDERYYLIEAREILEQNPALNPKFEGLVITYVDESIPSGRGPVRLLNINGYSTEFVKRHAYVQNTNSLFVSPEDGFMVELLSSDDKDYNVRIAPPESISYYTPREVTITVNDFLNRAQGGIPIDISKEDYTVTRLRTDQHGVARFNALQPGLYGITLDDCFRCVTYEPNAVIDPSKDSEIELVINVFIFQVAVILVVVFIVGGIVGFLLLRKHEREARMRYEASLGKIDERDKETE